ncbi:MAG: hypothetical protein ABIY55_27980 [Kofleriaceae bacterium]
MTRLSSLALSITLTGALAGTALAETQAEIALRLNEEGKQLMFADKPDQAAKKFQEAVARVPEVKYFVNLCAARLQEGKLDDALTACKAVDLNGPTPEQKDKAAKMIERINDEAKKQNLELHGSGGGGGDPGPGPAVDPTPDPAHGGPPNQPPPMAYRPAVGRPLGQSLVMAGTPDNQYTWTLGFDALLGGGRIGRADYYGSVAYGFRVKGDYMLDPVHRIGAQLYIDFARLSAGQNDNTFAETLDVVDFGLAGYKHLCMGSQSRLCFTPLIGAHLALMSPNPEMSVDNSETFNYLGVGGRAEVALTYAFGTRFEHVLSISGGVHVYSQILSGPSGNDDSLTIAEAGLDTGGAFGFLAVGYTYRFNTPLGSSPFVILE